MGENQNTWLHGMLARMEARGAHVCCQWGWYCCSSDAVLLLVQHVNLVWVLFNPEHFSSKQTPCNE